MWFENWVLWIWSWVLEIEVYEGLSRQLTKAVGKWFLSLGFVFFNLFF